MSTRWAYHKLHRTNAPEYLFEVQISDAGQYFYESMNPAFERLLGITIQGSERAIRDCVSEEDAKSISAFCDACLAEGKSVCYRQRLTLGGRRREFDTTINPVRDSESGNIVKLAGSHRAIEERSTVDADKMAKRRAAAKLDLRLLSLQEEVQQRIASDLHDSTCQHLIAASLTVMRLRRAMSDNGSAEKLFDDIDASIDQAQREIRAFTYLLHPQNLLTDGLKITVEQFVNGFSARTSLQTVWDALGALTERQRAVLRVTQEALMNVFRHARATQVKVAMETMGTHFRLRVTDDGRGMPINQARSGPKAISFGVGIPAMRARLRQLGGTLEIHSSSATGGRGTTLCAELPHALPLKRTRQRVRHHSHPGLCRSIAGQP